MRLAARSVGQFGRSHRSHRNDRNHMEGAHVRLEAISSIVSGRGATRAVWIRWDTKRATLGLERGASAPTLVQNVPTWNETLHVSANY